jgi:hypothetical protein
MLAAVEVTQSCYNYKILSHNDLDQLLIFAPMKHSLP